MGEKTVVDRMNELLEAERSGVIVYEQMAFLSSSGETNKLFATIRNNESMDCEMLHSLISRREVRPSDNMNGFADKVLALEDENDRIELILKGLSWVLRKISELPGEELTEEEKNFFLGMQNQHRWNIGMLRGLLRPEGNR